MAIELLPITRSGNQIRNTIEEIITFSRLNFDIVTPEEVQVCLEYASDLVAFHVGEPEDPEAERDIRAEPLKKRAESYLAVSELWMVVSQNIALTTPAKQTLMTLLISLGPDNPTPTDVKSAFERTAETYRAQGMRILRTIQPLSTSIAASDLIEDV